MDPYEYTHRALRDYKLLYDFALEVSKETKSVVIGNSSTGSFSETVRTKQAEEALGILLQVADPRTEDK